MSLEGGATNTARGSLERVNSLDDLWKKLLLRLETIRPCHAVDAGFACRGPKPLVHFHAGPAGAKLPWWPCTVDGNPMERHLEANVKSKLVRLSDLAPDSGSLMRTDFGQKVMVTGKWQHALTMCFRHEGVV